MSTVTEALRPERHGRQMLYARVGAAGQARLAAARVLVAGVGATGGAVANSLARAGVGLTLVDRDFVERHNLQRQSLFTDADAESGAAKASAAAAALRAVDPELPIEARVSDIHAGNILDLAAGHNLIVDGTDNFATRFVLNDAAVKLGIPWVYCGAIGAHGAVMVIEAGGRPCLRCLYPEAPPPGSVETCDTAGVLHPAVAVVGGFAAMEAMKLILGAGPRLRGMAHIDVWDTLVTGFEVRARPDCATCGLRQFPALDARAGGDILAAALCGRDAVHLRPALGAEQETRVDLEALAGRLEVSGGILARNPQLLRFRAEGHEITLFGDGRAIVKGTDDAALARGLYARWIGA